MNRNKETKLRSEEIMKRYNANWTSVPYQEQERLLTFAVERRLNFPNVPTDQEITKTINER